MIAGRVQQYEAYIVASDLFAPELVHLATEQLAGGVFAYHGSHDWLLLGNSKCKTWKGRVVPFYKLCSWQ